MKTYRFRFTPEARRLISHLHPENKKQIKKALSQIQKNPNLGDDLQEELSGFKSFKPKRYRILYQVDETDKIVDIYYVGHRKDVYDAFRRLLKQMSP